MPDLIYPPETWNPRPDQMPLWLALQEGVENIEAITHRQYGKDELFQHATACNALERPASYTYCLPKTVDVRKNMWEAVNPRTGISRIDEIYPESIRLAKLERDMIIRMPHEQGDGKFSNIMYTGSDNHTGLRGQTSLEYNFSEWAYCDPQSLAVIRPIVTANGGKMRFFTTAYGKNHAYKMLIENARKPNWRCFLVTNNKRHPLADLPEGRGIIHIQSHQIPEDKMKEILEENIQLYGPEVGTALTEQEYECSFEEIVPGSFYLDLLLIAEREGRITNIAPRPELPVYAFFDIGFTDPTAIWYVQVKEQGWLDCVGYDELTIISAPELVPILKKRAWYYGGLYLPHDGAHHEFTSGTTAESIMTTAGFRTEVMPRTDDAQQIPSVRTILSRCRFANIPEVQRGLECLRHFHNTPKMKDGRMSWSPRPQHDWSSHGAKAFATLGYFAPELQAGVKPPTKRLPDPLRVAAMSYDQRGQGWMR